MAHHVIYLPGVGDHKNAPFQIRALKKWNKFDLVTHFQLIRWNNSESYELKLKKVISLLDKLYSQNHTISLVGASAGASLAMNVYANRRNKIKAVVLICAKINNPQTLGQKYKTNYPALLDCVKASSQAVKNLKPSDKQKMLTINPLYDGVVARADCNITGVKNKIIIAAIHGISIGLAISLYKRTIIKFIDQ
jgi:pimeloyl-ACP methyl ester carboxylesterase